MSTTVAKSGTTVVVGNPKAHSRTRSVAEAFAAGLITRGDAARAAPYQVIEVAELSAGLFDWGSAPVRAAVDAVRASRIVVVASPVYKATYTGLLKSFLDWFGQRDLNGTVAFAVLVGATPEHALAVETHLRPLLVELGATVPARGLFVLESDLDRLDARLDEWFEFNADALEVVTR